MCLKVKKPYILTFFTWGLLILQRNGGGLITFVEYDYNNFLRILMLVSVEKAVFFDSAFGVLSFQAMEEDECLWPPKT
jgi:hypothetical protein